MLPVWVISTQPRPLRDPKASVHRYFHRGHALLSPDSNGVAGGLAICEQEGQHDRPGPSLPSLCLSLPVRAVRVLAARAPEGLLIIHEMMPKELVEFRQEPARSCMCDVTHSVQPTEKLPIMSRARSPSEGLRSVLSQPLGLQ